jgi:AraC-like DNA-binding protein
VTVVGLATRPLATHLAGGSRLAGIRLTPAGALRLAGDAMPHVLNGAADGTAIFPALAQRLLDAAEPFTGCGRTGEIEKLLRSALAGCRAANPRIEEAARLIHASAGGMRIAAVARHVGLSTRQIDRGFEKYLGLPPKLLGRLARFRRATDRGLPGSRGGWAAVAAECGYADQAHLVRDFQEFAGQPPDELRSSIAQSTSGV